MTGEPTHIASKERMVPELLFSSERVPWLSNTALKVQWPLRFTFSYVQPITQTKNSRRSASATIQLPQKYDSRAPNYHYCLESAGTITLRFQLLSLAYYTTRIVLESSLQSPQKIQTFPIYKYTEGKPCTVLP